MVPKLPFWLEGAELLKLRESAKVWWERMKGWAMLPVLMCDPETCTENFLNLIAYGRDIKRFDGEPLDLFRKRVKYAYANARDAGSVFGFKRIFARLGIGYVEVEERIEGQDWDIISLLLSDSQLSENQKLLETLIQHYGRTCRRYDYKIITPIPIHINTANFDEDSFTVYASVPPLSVQFVMNNFDEDSFTIGAKI